MYWPKVKVKSRVQSRPRSNLGKQIKGKGKTRHGKILFPLPPSSQTQANKTNTRAYNLANQTREERKEKDRKDTIWEDSLLVVETGCRDLRVKVKVRVSIPSPGKTLPRRLLHGSRRISSSISWKQILRPNRHLVEYLGWLPTTLGLDVLVGDRVQRGLDVRGKRLLSSTSKIL